VIFAKIIAINFSISIPQPTLFAWLYSFM
jgi:hypothetical protein